MNKAKFNITNEVTWSAFTDFGKMVPIFCWDKDFLRDSGASITGLSFWFCE